jgi:zinc/manganese transport system permease protein
MADWVSIFALLFPAFVTGVLISIVHVPLGQEVLRRGIIFLDLAVAQFAAFGMILFQALSNYDEFSLLSAYGRLGAGLLAALACALIFHLIEKRAGRYQEALIGCGFVLAASLGLLALANSPNGGEEIKHILEGQILWSGWDFILFVLPIFALIFVLWQFLPSKRRFLFYPLFALTIPFSVSMIGIYLVFASLIFPALAVLYIKKYAVLWGIFVSMISYASGLALSYIFDWPAGPAIILAFFLSAILFYYIRKVSLRV